MIEKPEIIFTFPSCMGGVASFNYNIINYSKSISQFYSKVILLKAKEDTRPIFLDVFKCNEVCVFNYSYLDNQYYVQKRLSQLLGTKKGLIVTDNALTIESANRFNNPKTIFHLLHDYFYVNQTIKLENMIDAVIAHSSFFSDAVYAYNPELFARRNFYIPYGVKQVSKLRIKNNKKLNLVFLGRLDLGKGVLNLKTIDSILNDNRIAVNWTIIGKGPLKTQLNNQWKNNENIKFLEPDSTDDVYKILKIQDILVFPTVFEGTPVSILECLANGVVTITNDLPGGIRDIVTEGIGYRCEINNLEEFSKHIINLNSDREKLKKMQQRCKDLCVLNFDINTNADNYFKKFLEFEKYKRDDRRCQPTKLSRLDHKFLPNIIVKSLRNIKNY